MPQYEYKCRVCEHITERIVSSHKQDKYICEKCGYTADRIISSTSFSLKGGGWERDGYASKKDNMLCKNNKQCK